MKKAIMLVGCLVLLPAAAFAQEKTLYDISQDIFARMDSFVLCADPDRSCSESEALAIKADAEQGLRDILLLIKSGDRRKMLLTRDQLRAVSSRVQGLQAGLVQIARFDTVCNFSLVLLNLSYNALFWAVAGLLLLVGNFLREFFVTPILVTITTIVVIPLLSVLLLLGIVLLAAGCIIGISCLFWWL